MRVFYSAKTTNFGDQLNSWLWPRLVPEILDEAFDERLVGIGSLIQSDLGKVPGRKIIFGTGSGYGPMPRPEEIGAWRIYCVRGPLTARLLELPPEKSVMDAAWLVDLLPDFRYHPGRRDGTVFVPHWTTDVFANWRQPCEEAGIEYVSPLAEGSLVLSSIAKAKLAIVESLHGAIMADYYRVPWIPVATEGRVLAFKWLDFCMALDLPYRPIRLPKTDWMDGVSIRQPDCLPNSIEHWHVSEDVEVSNTSYAAHSPATFRYRASLRLRDVARAVRSVGLKGTARLRELEVSRRAYEPRSRQLAAFLKEVSLQPATLSADTIRQAKLDALASVMGQMRDDYTPR